jgi:hypothetical protein
MARAKGKVDNLWAEAVSFQEETFALFAERWLNGNSTPSLLFLKSTVSHENLHLFSEDKLGKEGTLIYHVDNFLPLNQDPDMLLRSLEKLYNFTRPEIDLMLQAMDGLDLKEPEKKKALFYVLMDDREADIDSYLEDYIRLLVRESHAESAVLICEADMEEGGDCLHCYLEMDDGQVRILNIKRWGPDLKEDLEYVVLDHPDFEALNEHRTLGPFFPDPSEEEDDINAITCE